MDIDEASYLDKYLLDSELESTPYLYSRIKENNTESQKSFNDKEINSLYFDNNNS